MGGGRSIPGDAMAEGVLPAQTIRALIAQGAIAADPAVGPAQIQPASLDLRLGTTAYRVRASFLPGAGRTVAERIAEFEMHRTDLGPGAVLEKGCVYLVPLAERLALPVDVGGVANAKSSTGRLDLLTRTVIDGGTECDRIPPGYAGPLYAEICPRSFSVLVRPGMRSNSVPPSITVRVSRSSRPVELFAFATPPTSAGSASRSASGTR